VPATRRFGKFWKELLHEKRAAPIGARSRWWMRFVPRATDAGGTAAILTRDFSREEVSRIVYPPDAHTAPTQCHADCTVCRE
jgi:hypothetical protein